MSVPVIKFMFRDEWKVLGDAVKIVPVHEVESFDSANDLMNYLNGNSAGMIITSLQDKNDLVQLATVMKLSKKLAPNTLIKVMVINFSGDKQFEKAVEKLGIMDLIDPRIQTKALRFKIDFMMKSITVHVKKMASSLQAGTAVKSIETNKANEKTSTDVPAIWNESLLHNDDIWILKNEADCKKVLTRWLIKFMAPSPYVAQWIESNSPGIYKFEFKSEANQFVVGKGSWFFRGDQKPEFVWSENLWSFTGSAFELFYKDGNDIVTRMRLKDKQLTIAKNSEAALRKEKIIFESFDKDLVFQKDQADKAGTESVENETEHYKNLEGKGKTDALKSGPLSGHGKTDSIGGGPLSGKGQTSYINTDPMSMDVNPEDTDLSSDPLSMKPGSSKRPTHWKGKNAYEKEGAAGLGHASDQNISSGSELGMENKTSLEKFYKNHNEAEKFDAKDIGHAIKKDGIADNLSGKTSTDEIEGYLTSPDKNKDTLKKEKKKNDGSEKEPRGELSSSDATKDSSRKEKKNDGSSKELHDDFSSSAANLDSSKKEKHNGSEKELRDALRSSDTNKDTAKKEKNNGSEKELHDDRSSSPDENKVASEKGKKKPEVSEKDLIDDLLSSKLADTAFKKKADAALTGKSSTDKLAGHLSSPGEKKKSGVQAAKGASDRKTSEAEKAENNVVEISSRQKSAAVPVLTEPTEDLKTAMENAEVTALLVQDLVKVICKIDDFFDETIIFKSKMLGVQSDKPLILNMKFNYMNKDTTLKCIGKVSLIDVDEDGTQYINVEISDENVAAFQSFMKLYGARQDNINVFFKAVKGN